MKRSPGSSSFGARVEQALAWRRREWALRVNGWLARRGPGVFIGMHWPWPMRKPFERERLRLFSHGGGIGDELMCTPIFAEIKRRNPACHLTFITRHVDFFRGHSCIDAVEKFDSSLRDGAVCLAYEHALPPPRPIISLMAECAGLQMRFERTILPPLQTPPEEFQSLLAGVPKPRVVIQPLASRWTPNKVWPMELWQEFVRLLTGEFEVIEVGSETAFPGIDFGPHFHSLAGRTDLNSFAWTIGQADVFVGPVSGGMHLANAMQVPSVIVFGGYESPDGHSYPNVEAFYTQVACAPCWLTSGCPYDLKCLRAIRPGDVYAAVCRAVARKDRGSV